MALTYQPKAGDVVMCDFSGFISPEMIKTRPVIVVSKHIHNSKLVSVVPLSTTEPVPLQNYHYAMPKNPLPDKKTACWAKCDMIYTVSINRLDRYKYKDTTSGKRRYVCLKIDPACLWHIQDSLVKGLNFPHTRPVP